VKKKKSKYTNEDLIQRLDYINKKLEEAIEKRKKEDEDQIEAKENSLIQNGIS
jgi:hypothetical protein